MLAPEAISLYQDLNFAGLKRLCARPHIGSKKTKNLRAAAPLFLIMQINCTPLCISTSICSAAAKTVTPSPLGAYNNFPPENIMEEKAIFDAADQSPGPLLIYWPSSKHGGTSLTGHVALLFRSGMYLSHCPGQQSREKRSTRTDIPGLEGKNIVVYRQDSVRNRTLKDDLATYGIPQLQPLSAKMVWGRMEEFSKWWLLCNRPGKPNLQGPLPYYQLSDTKAGTGDHSQCASTVFKCLKQGVPDQQQHLHLQLGIQFEPHKVFHAAQQYLSPQQLT